MIFDEVNFATFEDAREYVNHGKMRNTGVICPCCDQRAKVSRRQMTSGMIAMLRVLAKETQHDEFIHVNEWVERTPMRGTQDGDYSKLAAWGLTEGGNRYGGKWRITQKGRDFLKGNVTIPKYTLIFNAQVVGYDGPAISIHSIR